MDEIEDGLEAAGDQRKLELSENGSIDLPFLVSIDDYIVVVHDLVVRFNYCVKARSCDDNMLSRMRKSDAGPTTHIVKVEKGVDARRKEAVESRPLDQRVIKPWFLLVAGMGTVNLTITGFVFRVAVQN
jgi:hypothetical protein